VFSIGVDAKNLTVGSQPTNNGSALDFQVRFLSRQNHIEFGLAYENFKRIQFQSAMINGNFVVGNDLQIALGLEQGMVIRNKQTSSITAGINGEIRYFYNNIGLSIHGNYRYRPDLYVLYRSDKDFVFSGFINIIYRTNDRHSKLFN
jgi:hypothetical protein